jgi:hypothetical protein
VLHVTGKEGEDFEIPSSMNDNSMMGRQVAAFQMFHIIPILRTTQTIMIVVDNIEICRFMRAYGVITCFIDPGSEQYKRALRRSTFKSQWVKYMAEYTALVSSGYALALSYVDYVLKRDWVLVEGINLDWFSPFPLVRYGGVISKMRPWAMSVLRGDDTDFLRMLCLDATNVVSGASKVVDMVIGTLGAELMLIYDMYAGTSPPYSFHCIAVDTSPRCLIDAQKQSISTLDTLTDNQKFWLSLNFGDVIKTRHTVPLRLDTVGGEKVAMPQADMGLTKYTGYVPKYARNTAARFYVGQDFVPGSFQHGWGQRKLFLVSLVFLTACSVKFGRKIRVVYAGAAPGSNILQLSHLFPDISWVLIDPAPFNPFLESNKSITIINSKLTMLNAGVLEPNDIFIWDVRRDPVGKEVTERSVKEDQALFVQLVRARGCKAFMFKMRMVLSSFYGDEGWRDVLYPSGITLRQPWISPGSLETRTLNFDPSTMTLRFPTDIQDTPADGLVGTSFDLESRYIEFYQKEMAPVTSATYSMFNDHSAIQPPLIYGHLSTTNPYYLGLSPTTWEYMNVNVAAGPTWEYTTAGWRHATHDKHTITVKSGDSYLGWCFNKDAVYYNGIVLKGRPKYRGVELRRPVFVEKVKGTYLMDGTWLPMRDQYFYDYRLYSPSERYQLLVNVDSDVHLHNSVRVMNPDVENVSRLLIGVRAPDSYTCLQVPGNSGTPYTKFYFSSLRKLLSLSRDITYNLRALALQYYAEIKGWKCKIINTRRVTGYVYIRGVPRAIVVSGHFCNALLSTTFGGHEFYRYIDQISANVHAYFNPNVRDFHLDTIRKNRVIMDDDVSFTVGSYLYHNYHDYMTAILAYYITSKYAKLSHFSVYPLYYAVKRLNGLLKLYPAFGWELSVEYKRK